MDTFFFFFYKTSHAIFRGWKEWQKKWRWNKSWLYLEQLLFPTDADYLRFSHLHENCKYRLIWDTKLRSQLLSAWDMFKTYFTVPLFNADTGNRTTMFNKRPFISIYLCILAWLIKQPNLDFEKSTKENRICQCGNNVGGTWPKDRWIACKVLWAAIIVMRQPPAGYCLAE